MALTLATFGITNDGLNLAVNLLLLFLVVLYFALIYWTYADAKRRMEDPMLIGCATAASLFPFVGTIVYTVVRPPEFLDDVRERELEIAAAEARLHSVESHHCPYCSFEIEKSFLRCPSCLRRLREPCQTCSKPLDPRWKICPYCESEIGGAQPAQQGQRAARSGAADGGAPRERERARRRERQQERQQRTAAAQPTGQAQSPKARERQAAAQQAAAQKTRAQEPVAAISRGKQQRPPDDAPKTQQQKAAPRPQRQERQDAAERPPERDERA